jgi:protein TonB
VAAGLMFSILPIARSLLAADNLSAEQRAATAPVIMRKVRTEEKKEKRRTRMIRRIQSRRPEGRSNRRDFDMKFSPELSVGGDGEGAAFEEGGASSSVFEEDEVDEAPVPISRAMVDYPRRAHEAGIEGVVSVILLIDRKGRVTQVTFESVPSPLFVRPVRETLRRWRFKPARYQGVPVKVRMRQNIVFNLEQ